MIERVRDHNRRQCLVSSGLVSHAMVRVTSLTVVGIWYMQAFGFPAQGGTRNVRRVER